MKTFLIIIASIILISALIIGYAYNQFTYQPDYFDEIEGVDIKDINIKADETEKRIAEELQENNSVKLNGEEILQIGLSQVSKKTNIDINNVVKKAKSEIVDGKLKTEALINVKALSTQKIPPEARQYVKMFMNYLPDAMMDEVYVSFEGTPVNENGTLRFSNDVIVTVGNFTQSVSGINTNRNIKVDLEMLRKMGLSDLVIHDDFIELKK